MLKSPAQDPTDGASEGGEEIKSREAAKMPGSLIAERCCLGTRLRVHARTRISRVCVMCAHNTHLRDKGRIRIQQ